jgi:hypothetical protein
MQTTYDCADYTANKASSSSSAPFVTKDELSQVGSCSKLTEMIQTDASFGISFEMEVASTSAGKAEPFLTEVITTSAPKQAAVRAQGLPALSLEQHVATMRERAYPRNLAAYIVSGKIPP